MLSSSAAVGEASQAAMSPAPTRTTEDAAAVTPIADLPLTSPLPVTVATAGLLDAQLTVRPVRVLPFASLRVAVSWTVWPVDTEAGAGVTVTDATGAGGGGAVTVIAAVPLFPSLVAVSVAAPTATPVACPVPFTVATAGVLLDHVTVRPPTGLPKASRVIAKYCAVCPTPIVAVGAATAAAANRSRPARA